MSAPQQDLRPTNIALVGSPNAGKTTLFNSLTGSRAQVGNYAGVTVERREGGLVDAPQKVRILDLPGTYSLEGETPDERIVHEVLQGLRAGEPLPDALLIVADATTLRRSLGLVLEAIEHGLPTLLVLTMIDEVKARGGRLDPAALSRELGIHVLGVVGHRGVGLLSLRKFLLDTGSWPSARRHPRMEEHDERFRRVDALCAEAAADEIDPDNRSDRIDRMLLHPVLGLSVFAVVMVLLFQSIFSWALPAMDLIDTGFGALAETARAALPSGWFTDLLTDGILAGVGGVVIFLPQIVILFLFLHLLQDVGYMARAAFVVDRVLGWAGLQGRSFVPLLSCFACAIPGMMAARTIASPRERLATILVAPFMTCSARLPVYALLIAAFVPAASVGPLGLQGLVMLALYLVGVLTALLTASLLTSTLLRGQISVFYMELPPYRWPTPRLLLRQVWDSAAAFLKRAGTIILASTVVLWVLMSFPKAPINPAFTPEQQSQANLEASVASDLGHFIEPAIAPLGFDWKIGVGLVASLAAREVFVSALAQLYAVGEAGDTGSLRDALRADIDPRTGKPVFDLPTTFSLLIFFVFALQCTSTIVVMARETGSWKWPALAFVYMLGLAWVGSFLTYNITSRVL